MELDLTITLVLVLSGISILLSIVAALIYIPTNSAQGFPFLHILPTLVIYLFDNRCKAILHYCLIYISLMISDVELLSMCPLGICVFFFLMSMQIFCPF